MDKIINVSAYLRNVQNFCASMGMSSSNITSSPIINDLLNDAVCPPVDYISNPSSWKIAREYEYWECQACGGQVPNDADSYNQANDMLWRRMSDTLYPYCPYCGRKMENSSVEYTS